MNQFWVRELPSGTCESGGGIPAPGQRGFTILELMIVIAIASILVTLAVPSFQSVILSTQRASALSSLNDAITTARAEAASRGRPVTLCATSDPGAETPVCSNSNSWHQGILVRDANPIQVWGASSDGVEISAGGFDDDDTIVFALDGTLTAGGTFTICDERGASEASAIVLNISGLARVAIDNTGNGVVEGDSGDVSC